MSGVPREFVFTRYPARQGLIWLRTAYTMFKQHRLGWVMLFLAYLLVLLVVFSLPFIGPLLAIVIKPVLAVGLLAAAWNQERGNAPQVRHLFQGFRANLWALLAIGAFLVAGAAVAVYASSLIDGGKLLELMGTANTMSTDQLVARATDAQVQLGMMFSSLVALPFLVAAWWAPALVVFQDARPGAALAVSMRAALANWKALAAYGLGVFVYWNVIPSLFITLVALVVPQSASLLLVILVLVPYWLFLAATLHVSDYVSYREVFHANETLAPLSRAS